MDWKAAIAAIKSIEGTSEPLSALEAEINRLTNANFELVKDVRRESSKSKEAETKLTDLLQLLGAEGEDLKGRVDSANEKAKNLQSENSKLVKEKGDLVEKYKSIESEKVTLQRRTLIQDAAAKTGAVADVLTTLAKDIPIERILVEKDGVAIASVDGKQKTPLKDYAAEQWAAFVPALFPSSPSINTTRLPNGGTSNGKPNDISPLQAYRSSTYDKTIERLTNKN